jgi:hypothetical protein
LSWNRYNYTLGDPINGSDPSELDDEDDEDDQDRALFYPGPQSPGAPKKPNCNPGNSKTVARNLDFITAYWNDASAVASAFSDGKSDTAQALATAFLEWSAWESHYFQEPSLVAANNYFGTQNKANIATARRGAAIPCVRGGPGNPIPANSRNACFPGDMTFGQELWAVLGTPSGKTGVTYADALVDSLHDNSGEGVSGIMQSIARNGWNTDDAYGSKINSVGFQAQINCLKQIGAIH